MNPSERKALAKIGVLVGEDARRFNEARENPATVDAETLDQMRRDYSALSASQKRYHQEGLERMRAYYADKKATELRADLSQAEWERRIYQERMRRGAPLLSANQLMCLVGIDMGNEMPLETGRKWNNDILGACQKVVEFYEQKITSGELVDPRLFWDFMVVECIADRSEYNEQEQAEEIARFVACVSDASGLAPSVSEEPTEGSPEQRGPKGDAPMKGSKPSPL